MKPEDQARLAEIETRLEAIRQELKPFKQEWDSLVKEKRALEKKSKGVQPVAPLREKVAILLGKPVKAADPRLKGLTGILKTVNRKMCEIDFGGRGLWALPLGLIYSAEEPDRMEPQFDRIVFEP